MWAAGRVLLGGVHDGSGSDSDGEVERDADEELMIVNKMAGSKSLSVSSTQACCSSGFQSLVYFFTCSAVTANEWKDEWQ